MKASVDAMAAEGLRVLGVAPGADSWRRRCRKTRAALPSNFSAWWGSPTRCAPSVPAAVAECRAAGIRVVMITGDYPATARAIARQAGLESAQIMTGDELERYTDASWRSTSGR